MIQSGIHLIPLNESYGLYLIPLESDRCIYKILIYNHLSIHFIFHYHSPFLSLSEGTSLFHTLLLKSLEWTKTLIN